MRRVSVPARSKKDTPKNNNKHNGQVKRVERKIELRMNFRKHPRKRESTITSKSVSHATRSRHNRNCSEKQTHQWESTHSISILPKL